MAEEGADTPETMAEEGADTPVDPLSDPPDALASTPTPVAATGDTDPVAPGRDSLEVSMDDDSDPLIVGDLEFNKVSIAVKIRKPKKGKPVVARLRAKGFKKGLQLGFVHAGYADSLQISASELPAFSNPKLVMIQLFMDSGEDAFSRSMVTALVFLGNEKSPPRILWRGQGNYQSYSDECQIIDVVYFAPKGSHSATIVRQKETIVSSSEGGELTNGDAKACSAAPKTETRVGTVRIP
jgi:hypothetical protein